MSDNEKETQVAEETQNTQAAAESNNASPVVASAVRVVVASVATVVRNLTRTRCSIAW